MKLFDLVCPIIAIQGPRKIMMFYTKDRRKKKVEITVKEIKRTAGTDKMSAGSRPLNG